LKILLVLWNNWALISFGTSAHSQPPPMSNVDISFFVSSTIGESVVLAWVFREDTDAASSNVVRSGETLSAAFDFTAGDEKENPRCSGSFGDSYALGIAGTGGTSSPSFAPAELWTFLVFGVGSRDPVNAGFARGCSVAFATLSELRLEFEDMEMPEAYDLRFWF
jgi:hypothetical protein